MLAPPPEIPTRVFAAMPEELQRADTPSRWVERVGRVVGQPARMGSFLEGPSFDREGRLYVTDLAHGRIFRITPDAEWHLVADYDGEPNGLKIHRDGRIIVTDQMHGLLEIDPENGKVTPFLSRDLIHGYLGVNDLWFTAEGDCWFTDQGQMTGLQDHAGRLMRYSAKGKLEVMLDRIASPNGLVMNLNESMMYLAVTLENAVWRVPFLDGRAVKVGVFSYLMGGLGPDGMALDQDGTLVFFNEAAEVMIGKTFAEVGTITGADFGDLLRIEYEDGTPMRKRDSPAGVALMQRHLREYAVNCKKNNPHAQAEITAVDINAKL